MSGGESGEVVEKSSHLISRRADGSLGSLVGCPREQLISQWHVRTALFQPFRAPLFGARNLPLSNSSNKQIPRSPTPADRSGLLGTPVARNDKSIGVTHHCPNSNAWPDDPISRFQDGPTSQLVDILPGLQLLHQTIDVGLLIFRRAGQRELHLFGGVVELAL